MNYVVFLFFFCNCFRLIAGDNLKTCKHSGNYTSNSTYHDNLKLVLSSLSNSTSETGYSNVTKGKNGSNQVFGLAMCRGDLVLPKECSPCLTKAASEILTLCPNRKNATVMYDTCFLRYSSIDFFGVPMGFVISNSYVKNSSADLELFLGTRAKLLQNLMFLATNGTFLPPLFSSGQSFISNGTQLYALTQCTRDLTSQSCFDCLQNMIKIVPEYSGSSKGSWYLGESCYLMYDDYLFFTPYRKAIQSSPTLPSSNGTYDRLILSESTKSRNTIIISITAIAAIFLASIILGYFYMLTKKKSNKMAPGIDQIIRPEFRNLEFEQLKQATCNFSDDNKLGQGGFGPVYKGVLEDGQNIAVKRLRKDSSQGIEELKNEVVLLAKLQHRNLVRIIGYCMEDDEMLLVYEYMPNTSLDNYIFDHPSVTLNWNFRLKIIEGICKGILYLHQDSRLMIVHRDLKLSNILLDLNMNPKIADFGLAKLFDEDKTHQTSIQPRGTLGYIAPEYLTFGQFSTRSDIYSFGVMVLEMCTGKKVRSSYTSNNETIGLLSLVWQHWNNNRVVELLDQNIVEPTSTEQKEYILRVFHIALLCVQHVAELRPNASHILHLFRTHSEALPIPSTPAWELQRGSNSNENTNIEGISNQATRNTSPTNLSITIPR
ncbi:Receptor-like protein kinase, putative,expressed [Zostera marina]|uniref:Receptor-like protein kinase, putative,expressed n=1 Tax=Zostera marina TaxID=29655 RepID=A0A0K9NKQ8_ZOSMR|nr:Receptor-like protein kinase, putative,expressed [Zostera marina]